MASDVAGYNVQGYIHKLELLTPYIFPFERLRRVEEQYAGKKKKVTGKDGKEKIVDGSSSESEDEEKKAEEEKKEEEKKEEEKKEEEKLEDIKEQENEDDEDAV